MLSPKRALGDYDLPSNAPLICAPCCPSSPTGTLRSSLKQPVSEAPLKVVLSVTISFKTHESNKRSYKRPATTRADQMLRDYLRVRLLPSLHRRICTTTMTTPAPCACDWAIARLRPPIRWAATLPTARCTCYVGEKSENERQAWREWCACRSRSCRKGARCGPSRAVHASRRASCGRGTSRR